MPTYLWLYRRWSNHTVPRRNTKLGQFNLFQAISPTNSPLLLICSCANHACLWFLLARATIAFFSSAVRVPAKLGQTAVFTCTSNEVGFPFASISVAPGSLVLRVQL